MTEGSLIVGVVISGPLRNPRRYLHRGPGDQTGHGPQCSNEKGEQQKDHGQCQVDPSGVTTCAGILSQRSFMDVLPEAGSALQSPPRICVNCPTSSADTRHPPRVIRLGWQLASMGL